ncbi:MAG: hypothetical protein AB3N14_16570 [Flavobacteriaceae bacterium]
MYEIKKILLTGITWGCAISLVIKLVLKEGTTTVAKTRKTQIRVGLIFRKI